MDLTSPLPSMSYFYPRSPRGERRDAVEAVAQLERISIHAPREGSDLRYRRA